MSATSYKPTNRAWLQRLVSRNPHQIIGDESDPYLLRWYLIPRNPFLNLYLHKFMRSDLDTPHDHPWWFVSLILRGEYDEETPDGRLHRRRPGSIAFRPAEWRHRVRLLTQLEQVGDTIHGDGRLKPTIKFWRFAEQPCWTLILTGRRARTWGFWCKVRDGELISSGPQLTLTSDGQQRFVPWQEFEAAGGCGES